MKFNYAFQKIVDLKANEKVQAEWMLSAALGVLKEEQDNLEQLQSDKEMMDTAIHNAAIEKASLLKLQSMHHYASYLERRIEDKSRDVNHAEQHVVTRKSHLGSKMQDENVWKKSKDKAWTVFRHQMLGREQGELDEMATVRFVMRSR